MTTLPIPASAVDPVLVAAALPLTAQDLHPNDKNKDKGGDHDELSLLRAFRSFIHVATSLEESYGRLREEVKCLRSELEDTQGKLRREQALAEISAVLAHEIRNPLGSLELFAGLLAEAELDAEPRQWVEQVQAGLRTLGATVNNVLHFHSLAELACTTVDLGQLLDGVQCFFKPAAHQAGVVLSLQNNLRGIWLSADRHRLEQVLQNLVLNALRATPQGGWIEIVGSVIDQDRSASIRVADTGLGIAAENLPRIFSPGFSTRPGSLGLGLAVCRKIVEQHGGALTAADRPQSGAVFTLTFPLFRETGTEGRTDAMPENRTGDGAAA